MEMISVMTEQLLLLSFSSCEHLLYTVIHYLQNNEVYLPNRLSSLQVPLIKYFPSGHTQVAPEGFSKQRNSHARSEHGLGTDQSKTKEKETHNYKYNWFQKHKIQ